MTQGSEKKRTVDLCTCHSRNWIIWDYIGTVRFKNVQGPLLWAFYRMIKSFKVFILVSQYASPCFGLTFKEIFFSINIVILASLDRRIGAVLCLHSVANLFSHFFFQGPIGLDGKSVSFASFLTNVRVIDARTGLEPPNPCTKLFSSNW